MSATIITDAQEIAAVYSPIELTTIASTSAEDEIHTTAVEELRTYLMQNVGYPISMEEFEIEGVAQVSFAIDTAGHIKSATIIESLGKQFDNEIMRNIKNIEKVSPIYINGAAKNYSIVVPVQFKL